MPAMAVLNWNQQLLLEHFQHLGPENFSSHALNAVEPLSNLALSLNHIIFKKEIKGSLLVTSSDCANTAALDTFRHVDLFVRKSLHAYALGKHSDWGRVACFNEEKYQRIPVFKNEEFELMVIPT
jgi:hypothetical protein